MAQVRGAAGRPGSCPSFGAISLLLTAWASPVWAIPTPDVIVGAFGTVAQIVALMGSAIGAVFVSVRRRRTARAGPVRSGFLWALAVAFLLSLAGNVWQHHSADVVRTEKLTRNLVRPTVQDGKQQIDDSLKELPYSKQLTDPRGLDPEDVVQILQEPDRRPIWDVRELEEYVMGRLEGAQHVRYPDLQADPSRLRGLPRPALLLCYGGNRSGELCRDFAEKGIETVYFRGGYQRWWDEKRPLVDLRARDSIRDVDPFPNRDVLLDTAEVMELWNRDDCQFVDTRYPMEYDAEHLKDALCLPVRKLTTPALEVALRKIPFGRKLVFPAYDKRSGFYGLIAANRLSKLGHQIAGRYPVPHEFYLFPAPKPGVVPPPPEPSAAAAPVAWWLARPIPGGPAAALVLLLIALRALLWPFVQAAERHRAALRACAAERAALRRRFRDPIRRQQELAALLRARGISQTVPALVGMLQVSALIWVVWALGQAQAVQGVRLGWLPDLGSPDPLRVLPVLSGAACFALGLTLGNRPWVRLLWGTALGLLFGWLLLPFRSAMQLAVLVNVVMATFHVFHARFRAAPPRTPARLRRRTLLDLDDGLTHPGVGTKARNLARLRRAGLPVPRGFVLASGFFAGEGPRLSPRAQAAVRRAFARLGAPTVAVRSSALAEDGHDSAQAGRYQSTLWVDGEQLIAAIEDVRAAMDRQSGAGGTCVLVQEMVPARAAGVLFTRHPRRPSRIVVELVRGTADRLVSGEERPIVQEFGRATRRLLGGDIDGPSMPLAPLLDLGLRCEALLGAPQDVEWAWVDGRFQILQSRPITRWSAADEVERERGRLLTLPFPPADAKPWIRGELSALLPFPTAASLDLMRRLWGPEGAVDQSAALYGLPFDRSVPTAEHLPTIFGWLYADRRAEARVFAGTGGPLRSFLTALRLRRERDRLHVRWTAEFLPAFAARIRRVECLDLSGFSKAECAALLDELVQRFVTEDYAQAEEINLMASLLERRIAAALRGSGTTLASVLTPVPLSAWGAPSLPAGDDPAEWEAYRAGMRHRSDHDYELAEPRYGELPAALEVPEEGARPARTSGAHAARPAAAVPSRVRTDLEALSRYASLREAAKHHVLREVAQIRRVLLQTGRLLGIGADVFHLSLDETREALSAGDLHPFRLRIQARRIERERFRGLDLPDELGAADLETAGEAPPAPVPQGELRGEPAWGDRVVTGRARVLAGPDDVLRFRDGEVLVASATGIGLVPLFARASALVTEVGGVLCHAAITAREADLPAVVGVRGATRQIRTGDLVRVHPDGRVERVAEERRAAEREDRSWPVELLHGGGVVQARTVNVSRLGVLLTVPPDFRNGHRIRFTVPDASAGPMEGDVVRETNGSGPRTVALRLCEQASW
jgi:phosphohistidine swiveling domain-containing protein/rhodanese-related sulfurtransferase